ncbi:hypothetical protein FT641_19590 [Bacillus paranthracis]|uniref:hypothetical protein n=1 Tax=Bacillus paranthracis TaxID=2026186 RepID=UPI001879C0AF|nr:hypothetical protein [Bacillus paranthracis]MBE7114736.1 hypothetical protein [Bacillus paranthracis]MBE7154897.1 hypothetical protein [Bacillus paranthracis]
MLFSTAVQPFVTVLKGDTLLLCFSGSVTLFILGLVVALILEIRHRGSIKVNDWGFARKTVNTVGSVICISFCWVYMSDALNYIKANDTTESFNLFSLDKPLPMMFGSLLVACVFALTEFEAEMSSENM